MVDIYVFVKCFYVTILSCTNIYNHELTKIILLSHDYFDPKN